MDRKEKIKFLIENIKGVGPSKAEKIADAFAHIDTLTTIAYNANEYDLLKATVGLSLAKSIMDQLIDIMRQDNAVQLMVECGIPYFSAPLRCSSRRSYRGMRWVLL